MPSTFAAFLIGALTLIAAVANTLFWAVPLFAITALKLLLPALRPRLSQVLADIAEHWIGVNNWLFWRLKRVQIQVSGIQGLSPHRWYLILSNHATDVDITLLQYVFFRRIPFIRFFIKQNLIWVPILGQAWWALDFPFLMRHSAAHLARYPERRRQDLDTVRRACAKFRALPTSILSFAEGTRFTTTKHSTQESPYTHLLKPKAGGVAIVLAAMGEMFTAIVDVTIVYPDGAPTLWSMFSGRIRRAIVHVEQRPIPHELLGSEYSDDLEVRERYQAWIQELWRQKDVLIDKLLREGGELAT